MKTTIAVMLFALTLNSFASSKMVLNITSIHDTGVKNLIGLDGRSMGSIDCDPFLMPQPVRDFISNTVLKTNNGIVGITLEADKNKIISKKEIFHFQNKKSCQIAIDEIEKNATTLNPVSLILEKGVINRVFISTNF